MSAPPAVTASPVASHPADAPAFHWVATWGTAATPGELSHPSAIALDAADNVYVADAGNHRVQVFTPNGAFLHGFGQAGRGDGEFYDPQGITIHGDSIYVSDKGNSRIQVFTLDGVFVRQIGAWGATSQGLLQRPGGLGVDAADWLYVVDVTVGRYSIEGVANPLGYITCKGQAIAVLSTGAFFCSATYGLLYIPTTGSSQLINNDSRQPGYLYNTVALTTAPDDSFWSYDLGSGLAKHFNAEGGYLGGFPVDAGVVGLAASSDRLFALTDTSQVTLYDWNGNRLDAWGVRAFDTAGSFDRPDRLAAAPDGTFYVLERERKRIQHLDGNGNVLAVFGTGTAPQGNLAAPQDIAVDGLGRLYVLDDGSYPFQRVVRFVDGAHNATTPVRYYYSPINTPPVAALAISGDNLLLINNWQRILRTDLDGVRIAEWSSAQPSEYSLGHMDATITAEDRAYILHQLHTPAVRVRSLRGDSVVSWGQMHALEPGSFVFPTSIAADLRGRIFILDSDNRGQPSSSPLFSSRVQVFDEQGQYLTEWGGFGGAAGQFVSPQSILALPDGRIVVADTGNNRLQVFAPAGPLPGRIPPPDLASYGPALPPISATWHDGGPVGGSLLGRPTIPPIITSDHPILAPCCGGLAASTDGVHWTRLSATEPGGRGTSQFAYAGSSTLITWGGEHDAPWRSTDLGRTWTRMGDAPITSGVAARNILPAPTYDSDGILYNWTSGFWRSADRGDTWERRGPADINLGALAVAVDSSGVRILLASNSTSGSLWGMLRSTDDGLSWQCVYNETAQEIVFSPTFAQDKTSFAVKSLGSTPKLLRSTDGGISWTRIADTQCSSSSYCYGVALSPAYGIDRTLAIWTGGGNSYLSTDAGETWSTLGSSASGRVLDWIVFAPTYPQDHRIWRLDPGRADGYQVTIDNGLSWQVAGNMPGAAIAGLIDLEESGDTVWGATPNGLLATQGVSDSWTWLHTWQSSALPEKMAIARSPSFETDGTAIVYDFMTTDGGVTWQPLSFSADLRNRWSMGAAFAPDYSQSHISTVVWQPETSGTNSKFAIAADGGANWQQLNVPVALARAIAFDPAWPTTNTIYVGGEGGLALSNDLGQTWQLAGEPVVSSKVVALVSRMEGGQRILYAATRTRGVWRSSDGGQNWAAFNTGLLNGHTCALAQAADLLAVGLCDGNVYLWQNAQASWQRLGDPVPGGINALVLQRGCTQGVIWAGTRSGIFRTTFPALEATPRLWLPLITRTGNTVTLSWAHDAANHSYEMHRSTTPYFVPTETTLRATVTGAPFSYTDPDAVVGNPSVNYFHLLRATRCAAYSDPGRVGEIDFSLVPGD